MVVVAGYSAILGLALTSVPPEPARHSLEDVSGERALSEPVAQVSAAPAKAPNEAA